MKNKRKDSAPVGESDPLRLTSARMEDWIVDMSYFWQAARRVKVLSSESGNSDGTGYKKVTRLFKISASSETRTTGRPSTTSESGGWGSENMTRKKGEAVASIGLWRRKSTRSDDLSITSALDISAYRGRDGHSLGIITRPSAFVPLSKSTSRKSDSACQSVQTVNPAR